MSLQTRLTKWTRSIAPSSSSAASVTATNLRTSRAHFAGVRSIFWVLINH
jgi:hypothetical protein